MDEIMYEDGKQILSLSRTEREQKAAYFSEGNKNLYEILMFLWDCGVETISCCVGHQDYYADRHPHLAVVLNEKSKPFLSVLHSAMGKVFTDTEKLEIGGNGKDFWFSINDYAYMGCEELFTKINVIKNESVSITPLLDKIYEALDKYRESSINLRFSFEANESNIFVTRSNDYPFFSSSDDLICLINHIKKGRVMKTGKYTFDYHSLDKFIKLTKGRITFNKETNFFEYHDFRDKKVIVLNKKAHKNQ